MKQALTYLLALLLALPTLAQTSDPLRQKLDDVFTHLDKSQVPTGRLAEYATPLIDLHHFPGTLADSALPDMDALRSVYATALSSRIYGQDTLPSLLTLNQRLEAAAPTTASAPIAVAVLSLNYDQLRPDAESAGLVSIQNEQVYDVAGRSQSPYQTNALFAVAPERSYVASPTVSLILRSNLYLSDGQLVGTPTPYLDFADGRGYRLANWNWPLGTTYATGGTKRVRLKLVYTYGKKYASISYTRESWFVLHVPANLTARYAADLAYSSGAGFDQPFGPTTTYPPAATDYTHHLGAMVNVRYGNGHTSIVKPFIVVEGYNTATIAPHLTGMNNQNNTIYDFLNSIDRDFATTGNFNDKLEKAGYDLIYIDFNYGTDDIRRNAALFEEVVRWVNTQKQNAGSQEPNVVMGESMGGLVARYGLARLVRNGYNPQTRLLVLHDSPQRGANNPMGLQALTRMADFPVPLRWSDYAGQFRALS